MRVLQTRFVHVALLIAFLLSVWTPASARAADPFVLPGELEFALSLGPAIQVYEDRTGQLDFEQVRKLDEENPDIFQPAEIKPRASLRADSSWWLRITIANMADTMRQLVLVAGRPNLESVDFYVQQGNRSRHTRAGTLVPILQQQDLSRFPTLRLALGRRESAQIWIKIKSEVPFSLDPTLYTSRLFSTAATMTTSADGILIGVGGALVWCMLLIGIIARRPPFLLMAAICATALLREATAREYLQRLLWPLDATWGYRLELTLDVAYVALCALFVRSAGRREAAAPPGTRFYPAAMAALFGCLLLALLWPAQAALLPLHTAVRLLQVLSGILAACMLGSATLLAWRARPPLSVPIARRAVATAALLGLSALFIVADALIRTTGDILPTPLIPIPFILRSGSPALALMATAANLTVLTLWAVRQLGWGRRSRILATSRPSAVPRPAAVPDTAGEPRKPANARAAPASTPASAHALPDATARDTATPASIEAPRPAITHETERQATMLSYVGHDLRAPLAIISGYVRLLRQAAAPVQHAYLDVIERSVGHQFSLIEEVLAYSKSELQPFAVHVEEIDLPALLEELAHFGVALCMHQRNTFEYQPAPMLPAMVRLDGKRLRQAVLNLLSNASKFTAEGRVRLDARVRRHADKQAELHLGIFNDGPHIPAENQPDIFVAFKRLHRREAGLGLGLFIVERIAHGMGGTIEVESGPERGNRFSLTVPITLVNQSVVATRPLSRAPPRDATAPLEAPPLAVRLTLSRLARDGELSEIESWVIETRAAYPQYTVFYDEVAKCVETFDMERLQRLSLQGMA